MKSGTVTLAGMGLAFCAALCLAAIALAVAGTGETGTDRALAITARLSFLLFWPAYAGPALAGLFGAIFQPLQRHARDFGLAFASAHLVHVALVVWLCLIGAAPAVVTFAVFGIALIWTYLLALFSIGRLRRALDPTVWWLLRTIGMNYIAFAFALDFLRHPAEGGVKHVVSYLPFAVLAVAGPVLILAHWLVRVAAAWRRSSLPTG